MIGTGQTINANDFWGVLLGSTKSNSGVFAEETILSGTLPASVLTSGRGIRISCNFDQFDQNNGGAIIKLKIGTTTIVTLNATNGNNGLSAQLSGIIRYNGSNAEKGELLLSWSKTTNSNALTSASGAATETLSGSLPIELTIEGTGTTGLTYSTDMCIFELL